jgi:hypothetical protein
LYVLAVNVKERPAVDAKERVGWDLKKGRAFDCLWAACLAQARPKSSGALMLI